MTPVVRERRDDMQKKTTAAERAFEKWGRIYGRFGLKVTEGQKQTIIQNALGRKNVSEAVRSQLFDELAKVNPYRAMRLVLGNIPSDVLSGKQRKEIMDIATRGGDSLRNVYAARARLVVFLPKAGTPAAIREARARKAVPQKQVDMAQALLSGKDQKQFGHIDESLRMVLGTFHPYLREVYDKGIWEAAASGQVVTASARIQFAKRILSAARTEVGKLEVLTTGRGGEYTRSRQAIAEIKRNAARSLGIGEIRLEDENRIVAEAQQKIDQSITHIDSFSGTAEKVDRKLVAAAKKKASTS